MRFTYQPHYHWVGISGNMHSKIKEQLVTCFIFSYILFHSVFVFLRFIVLRALQKKKKKVRSTNPTDPTILCAVWLCSLLLLALSLMAKLECSKSYLAYISCIYLYTCIYINAHKYIHINKSCNLTVVYHFIRIWVLEIQLLWIIKWTIKLSILGVWMGWHATTAFELPTLPSLANVSNFFPDLPLGW